MENRRMMKRKKKFSDNRRGAPVEDPQGKKESILESWKPKTEIGRKVSSGQITKIDEIIDAGQRIMEAEIVDVLLPSMSSELLMIGQAKGKFGGGKRRAFKQTQKKTAEGNKPSFGTMMAIGNMDGYVGVGRGKSRETLQSREKAEREAKLSLIKIRRGCGSWQCGCKTPHTIPFKVTGKCGSVSIEILPAPKGVGLRVAEECRKMLELAGVKDAWSKTTGQTRTTVNLIKACFSALTQLSEMKIKEENRESLGISEGSTKKTPEVPEAVVK
jgi:small subunit ribosomal protein S5